MTRISDPSRLDDDLEARLAQFEAMPDWTPRAGRRNYREKFLAGARGLKYAYRGDSSFFVHTYRALLVALAAVLVNIGPFAWCLLVLVTGFVFVAELGLSAIDTLARSLGVADEPGPTAAREIATAAVLVAVVVFAGISAVVLGTRFVELIVR
jgi:diacylglycerol kinase (ATP)